MEAQLLDREEEFKEFAQKVTERAKGLNRERMNFNDGYSMSED